MKLKDMPMIPCCQILYDKPNYQTREEIIEKVTSENGFGWKNEIPISSDPDEITHLELLEEFEIPYINDIHAHFFPKYVFKLIWRWFDQVNWPIAYRFEDIIRLEYLQKNRNQIFYYFMLCS